MLTAAVMTCGGIEFKTKGRDDQAECENIGPDSNILHLTKNCVNGIARPHGTISGYPGKVAGALQIDAFQMIKAFCKPRIKVGTEWVSEHYCEHYYQII